MQLTRFTDFSLRVLVYVGLHPDQLVTISQVADAYDIPRNHLIKVVNQLAANGFVHTTRGNRGGMRLARSPNLITIGAVVRKSETHMDLVECFEEKQKQTSCPLVSSCLLRGALQQAKESFFATLDKITLADCLPTGRVPAISGLVRLK